MIRQELGAKRKRAENGARPSRKKRLVMDTRESSGPDLEAIERRISEDPVKYRSDAEKLFGLLQTSGASSESNLNVGLSICKVYMRLVASGRLVGMKQVSASRDGLYEWYFQKIHEYRRSMVEISKRAPPSMKPQFHHLCWQILIQDAELLGAEIWISDSIFKPLVLSMVESLDEKIIEKSFVVERLNEWHDFCFHCLEFLTCYTETCTEDSTLTKLIEILSYLQTPPDSQDQVQLLVSPSAEAARKSSVSPTSLRRRGERAWLAILKSPNLTPKTRKHLLRLTTTTILPWISRPETLMDFLTDSYNLGGSTSLLALTGLFHLISTRNLDYPSFYPKLYSLLDPDLLHSKHRSRFLRLLMTFLDSPRLPASLIASFIKRLSRRALFGPPAAIVAIIPYIYNLLKAHPTCTFMIHRNPWPPYTKSTDNLGHDPFNMDEPDPQKTDAISSSLWEIDTLRSHYHPNVASIARIISQQFTKQQYNVEDFLDHGYGSLIESELGKEPKREPIVEWKIPKRIITSPGNGEKTDVPESLITRLWTF